MNGAPSPFGLPPEEAIRYFREKGYKVSFNWQDMVGEEHARAFTVAKATQLDLLADIRAAVDKALAEGATLEMFRKQLTPLLQQKGWWGEKVVQELDADGNEVPGSRVLVQLGSANRLRTIYETNLRMAHSAGRWERMQRTKDRRPYARYVALIDGNERAEHRAWHGTILPLDDPWWDTHYPPNGWGCRCKVQQLSERDLERYGFEVSRAAPPSPMVSVTKGGATFRVPKGIDPSFAYNVGKARAKIVAAAGGKPPAPWHDRTTVAPGKADERARKFSPEERAISAHLAREGNDVTSRSEKARVVGPGKKFDAFVNGRPTEFKTPKKGSKGGIVGVLRQSVRGSAQAPDVIVDVRGQGMTEAQVRAEVEAGRKHLKNRLQHVRIISDTFDLTISNLSWP